MTTEDQQEDDTGTLVETVTDAASDLMDIGSGLPPPIKKNFIKAFGQLCTSATDVGVAYFEGKATEIRTTNEARASLSKEVTKQIAESMNVPAEYAELAVHKHASKIVGEQINKDKTLAIAKDQLEHLSQEGIASTSEEDISEDWLNVFDDISGKCSSEKMQALFGKILADEIKNPSSFSIRAIKLVHELDSKNANLFQKVCSYSIGLKNHSNEEEYSQILLTGMSGTIGNNSLAKFGLNLTNILSLVDCGLLNSELSINLTLDQSVVALDGKSVSLPVYYRGQPIAFRQTEKIDKQEFKLSGAQLTAVGREIYPIIELLPNDNFNSELSTFLGQKKLRMEAVKL